MNYLQMFDILMSEAKNSFKKAFSLRSMRLSRWL